jgi:hypothetical protein
VVLLRLRGKLDAQQFLALDDERLMLAGNKGLVGPVVDAGLMFVAFRQGRRLKHSNHQRTRSE